MSRYLSSFYNGNDETIRLVNKETDDSWSLKPDSLTTLDLIMPECSDSELPDYFDANHIELRRLDGTVVFSFWTDPNDHDRIKRCTGAKWQNGVVKMDGYNPTDDADVGVALVNQTQEIRAWSLPS